MWIEQDNGVIGLYVLYFKNIAHVVTKQVAALNSAT